MNVHFSKGPVEWEDLIRSGTKTVTFRDNSAGRYKVGQKLHLVFDRFKPTRRVILETVCHLEQVNIDLDGTIRVNDQVLSDEGRLMLAKADGFESVAAMLEYHRPGFGGTIVNWGTQQYVGT